jgi:hypothetical protein
VAGPYPAGVTVGGPTAYDGNDDGNHLTRDQLNRFQERLWLPWWAWLMGLAIAAVLAVELTVGAPLLRHPAFYAAAVALAAAGLFALGRIRIRVTDAAFHVDDAHLPVEFIAAASSLEPTERRDLLGVDADPLAFVIQRPWIRGSVRVDLNDPADPTPYWVVSTRRPGELVAALDAAVAAHRR